MPNASMITYNNERIECIDILRGLCMVLIVWHHTDHPNILNYTFYNETLFFVSGMLFKPCGWSLFVKKRIQRFLVPFFFFYIVYYLFLIFLNYLKYHAVSSDIYLSIFDVFRWYKDYDAYTCNYPLWFIWALFWVQVQTNFLVSLLKKYEFLFIISLTISILGYMYIQHIPTPLITGRSTSFLVYYVAGYLSSQYLIQKMQYKYVLMASVVTWSLLLFIISSCPLSTFIKTLFHIFIYIAFSIILLQLCKNVQPVSLKKTLAFFGVNSIVLFGMHDMYLTILRIFTFNTIGRMDVALGCANWMATLLFMTPTIYFINRYLPFLIGRERRKLDENYHTL